MKVAVCSPIEVVTTSGSAATRSPISPVHATLDLASKPGIQVADLARPQTQVMVNLGNPDLAFKTSFLPNDGVGLARMEFIISEYIRVHPLALLHPERVDDPEARREIDRLTNSYVDGSAFFVERLSEGIGTIAAAFSRHSASMLLLISSSPSSSGRCVSRMCRNRCPHRNGCAATTAPPCRWTSRHSSATLMPRGTANGSVTPLSGSSR